MPDATAGGAVDATAVAATGGTEEAFGAGAGASAEAGVVAACAVGAVWAALLPLIAATWLAGAAVDEVAGGFKAGNVGGVGKVLPGVTAATIGGGVNGVCGAGRWPFAFAVVASSRIIASLGMEAAPLLSNCRALL